MSPSCDKSSKNDGPKLHLSGFGSTLGTNWDPRGVFFRGRVFDVKKSCGQPRVAPGDPGLGEGP